MHWNKLYILWISTFLHCVVMAWSSRRIFGTDVLPSGDNWNVTLKNIQEKKERCILFISIEFSPFFNLSRLSRQRHYVSRAEERERAKFLRKLIFFTKNHNCIRLKYISIILRYESSPMFLFQKRNDKTFRFDVFRYL